MDSSHTSLRSPRRVRCGSSVKPKASKSSINSAYFHPEYGDKILAGQKRVEFRKTRFASAVTHVVLYATAPVQQIIGYFKVKGIDQASPGELWRRYPHVGGIRKKSFKTYYEDRTIGVAIKVGKVFGLRAPRPLASLGTHVTPPQSFRYLPPAVVQQLAPVTIGQR